MNTILTLCANCAEIYRDAPGMRVKQVIAATTEKKKYCVHCRRRGSFSRDHVQSGRK